MLKAKLSGCNVASSSGCILVVFQFKYCKLNVTLWIFQQGSPLESGAEEVTHYTACANTTHFTALLLFIDLSMAVIFTKCVCPALESSICTLTQFRCWQFVKPKYQQMKRNVQKVQTNIKRVNRRLNNILQEWLSPFIQLSKTRRGWGQISAPSHCLCSSHFSALGRSWDFLCWNTLKSIREWSIDLMATHTWLSSTQRTQILILILHSSSTSQSFRNKAITWSAASSFF